jgi:hypothetical protein
MIDERTRTAYHEAGHCEVGQSEAPPVAKARMKVIKGVLHGDVDIPNVIHASRETQAAVALGGIFAEARVSTGDFFTARIRIGEDLFAKVGQAVDALGMNKDLLYVTVKLPMNVCGQDFWSDTVHLTREDITYLRHKDLFKDNDRGFHNACRRSANIVNSNDAWGSIKAVAKLVMDNEGEWVEDPYHNFPGE